MINFENNDFNLPTNSILIIFPKVINNNNIPNYSEKRF